MLVSTVFFSFLRHKYYMYVHTSGTAVARLEVVSASHSIDRFSISSAPPQRHSLDEIVAT